MKHSIFLILLMISLPVCAQDITGSWSWNSDDGEAHFNLELKKENDQFTGSHCGVFHNGDKIDCSEGTETEASVKVVQIAENMFEGSIASGYSPTTGKVRLKYDPEEQSLRFQLIEKPSGIFYLPTEITLR